MNAIGDAAGVLAKARAVKLDLRRVAHRCREVRKRWTPAMRPISVGWVL